MQEYHNASVSSTMMVCEHYRMPSWNQWNWWLGLSSVDSVQWYFGVQRSVQYMTDLFWSLLVHHLGFGPLHFGVCWATLVKTLPGIDNRVIPLQLLQSLRLPFLSSFTIIPFLQASGTSCQMLLNSTTSCPVIVSLLCLSISAEILSMPWALLLVRLLIARATSSAVMAVMLTSSSSLSLLSSMSSSIVGSGWFSTSLLVFHPPGFLFFFCREHASVFALHGHIAVAVNACQLPHHTV